MKKIFVAITFLAFMFFAQKALAATYYVDSVTGLDSNNGTTLGTPWQTLTKVNAAAFLPGDNIFFKRGDTWRGQLIVSSSGTADNPITFGAYGIGNAPLLLGSKSLNSTSDWTGAQASSSTTVSGLMPGASSDNERYVPGWGLIDNTLELGNNSGQSEEVGIRFLNVTIPQGATITAAAVTFKAQYSTGSPVNIQVKGQLSATPTTFNGVGSDLTGRTRTTSFVNWNTIPAWTAGTKYTTPDLTSVVQDIVNLPGWTSGSNLALFFKDNGSDTVANAIRLPFAYADGGDNIESLSITYSATNPMTNVWETTATIPTDVGSLIFNSEGSVGVKKSSLDQLLHQGDFFYDSTSHNLYIYSVGNPATFYSSIEAAQRFADGAGIMVNYHAYVTVQDFNLKYFGANAIDGSGDNVIIQHNNASFIGGSYESGTIRYGNGVQFYDNSSNVIVRYNNFDNIYDSAMTTQSGENNTTQQNNAYYYNTTSNSEGCFELWSNGTGSILNNISFENNTCVNTGGGWAHTQRPDQNEAGIVLYPSNVAATNIVIKNNIFSGAANYFVKVYSTWNNFSAVTLDNNDYYSGTASPFSYLGTTYDFSGWKSISQKDAATITADPKLISSSNFALQSTSPAIDTGANLGTTYQIGLSPTSSWTSSVSTLNQNSNGTGWELGAYVYPSQNAVSYTMSGPTTGTVDVASSTFTVTPDNPFTGTITITPSGGGLTIPIVLAFSNSATPQAFTITPTAAGTVTLTSTNNGSLANPSVLSYAATAAVVTTIPSTVGYVSGGQAWPTSATQSACLPGDNFSATSGLPCSSVPVLTTTTSPVTSVNFRDNLSAGMTNDEVKSLQQYLNAHGFSVAKSGAGSVGKETTYFGPATKAAVEAFQKAKGISPTSGYFGPLTRAYIAKNG